MAPTWCLSHTKSDSRAVWTRFTYVGVLAERDLFAKEIERWTHCGPKDVTERAKRSI